jgi:hypothetical protein
MVHGFFKPGKHVKKLYSCHKVSTNPWFQTIRRHQLTAAAARLFTARKTDYQGGLQ